MTAKKKMSKAEIQQKIERLAELLKDSSPDRGFAELVKAAKEEERQRKKGVN